MPIHYYTILKPPSSPPLLPFPRKQDPLPETFSSLQKSNEEWVFFCQLQGRGLLESWELGFKIRGTYLRQIHLTRRVYCQNSTWPPVKTLRSTSQEGLIVKIPLDPRSKLSDPLHKKGLLSKFHLTPGQNSQIHLVSPVLFSIKFLIRMY